MPLGRGILSKAYDERGAMKKEKTLEECVKRATLYALLISTMLLVGMCYAGSNSMAASKTAAAEKDIVDTAVAAEISRLGLAPLRLQD